MFGFKDKNYNEAFEAGRAQGYEEAKKEMQSILDSIKREYDLLRKEENRRQQQDRMKWQEEMHRRAKQAHADEARARAYRFQQNEQRQWNDIFGEDVQYEQWDGRNPDYKQWERTVNEEMNRKWGRAKKQKPKDPTKLSKEQETFIRKYCEGAANPEQAEAWARTLTKKFIKENKESMG